MKSGFLTKNLSLVLQKSTFDHILWSLLRIPVGDCHLQEVNTRNVGLWCPIAISSGRNWTEEKMQSTWIVKYNFCGASTSAGILLSMKQVQRILWGSPESPPVLMEWTWDESSWRVKRVGDPISGRKKEGELFQRCGLTAEGGWRKRKFKKNVFSL